MNLIQKIFLLPIKSGELILFPSTLKHSVPINTSNKNRISLSFNTFVSDKLGSEIELTELNIKRNFKTERLIMKNVDDYIYVTNVIPKKLCKKTIKILQNNKWYKHAWYDTTSKSYDSEKK